MTSVQSLTLDVPDPTAATDFDALAMDAGVSPDGTGSHRIVIGSDAAPFTDPDGFAWETATGPA